MMRSGLRYIRQYSVVWMPREMSVHRFIICHSLSGTKTNGSFQLFVWNLNEDIEAPIARTVIENENGSSQGRRLAFSANGTQIRSINTI